MTLDNRRSTLQEQSLPLISCLCVTRNKPEQLKTAVNCFHAQTYPNRELLIIFEEDDPATRTWVTSLDDKDIRYVEVPAIPKLSLGILRNLSVDEAKGEYFCQWDDDDWYHEERLTAQYEAILMNHKQASFLAYWFMYDHIRNRSFMSHLGPWPGTIMCKKSILSDHIRYSDFSRHEDYALMAKLTAFNYAFPLVMPYLYIYSYHGKNTFGQAHFDGLFDRSQAFSPAFTTLFKKIFNNELSNAEASRILKGPLLEEIDYFYNTPLPHIQSDEETWNPVW